MDDGCAIVSNSQTVGYTSDASLQQHSAHAADEPPATAAPAIDVFNSNNSSSSRVDRNISAKIIRAT